MSLQRLLSLHKSSVGAPSYIIDDRDRDRAVATSTVGPVSITGAGSECSNVP